MSIEYTARGSGYFRVYVDNVEFSKHTTEREAIERASKLELADSSRTVHYSHDYIVDVESAVSDIEMPPEIDTNLVSDSGVDLVDFLSMLDEQANGPLIVGTVLETTNFYDGIQQLTIQHRDSKSWLFQRLIQQLPNGDLERVGLSWRGYMLLWHLRDKNTIRINT